MISFDAQTGVLRVQLCAVVLLSATGMAQAESCRAESFSGASYAVCSFNLAKDRVRHSRQTPHELVTIGESVGFNGEDLAKASRLVAKVDSAAVEDGYDLYLHGFIVTDDAKWVVVQQGMNGDRRQARRYHWLSEGVGDFVNEPHAAIEGVSHGEIIKLT